MKLLVAGVSHGTASLELRERLAMSGDRLQRALAELAARYGSEAVILSTCNRVEFYLGRVTGEALPDRELLAEFLAEFHVLPVEKLGPSLYGHEGANAVRHLYRVASSLDSLVLGEGQIAGQVREAYEEAGRAGTVGPLLHALFQQARAVSRRVRTETGIAQGKVSVSSLAIDYVTEVFSHFGDKTVLVIGAGKMGELTLGHLRALEPEAILVTNRSPEKARQVAARCGGQVLPFEELDAGLVRADIVLSTTGSPEPIVTLERFQAIEPRRAGRHAVIIDIAVPRDFDPRIGDLDLVDLLVNIDDLNQIRARVLQSRLVHVPAAEAIIQAEVERFLKEWSGPQAGPAIARLSRDWDAIRVNVQEQCFKKLNGKLSAADLAIIEGAFKLLQNKFMHTPLSVLKEEHPDSRKGLLEAIYRLFRLQDS
jgi:glutamyl-tRNA reductase